MQLYVKRIQVDNATLTKSDLFVNIKITLPKGVKPVDDYGVKYWLEYEGGAPIAAPTSKGIITVTIPEGNKSTRINLVSAAAGKFTLQVQPVTGKYLLKNGDKGNKTYNKKIVINNQKYIKHS